jgi:molybdopterin synthase sulfur carrier subunit
MAAEAQVTVWIPALLRNLAGGNESVRVSGRTLREVIDALDDRFPGIKERLCDENGLRSGVAVAIDNRLSARSLSQSLPGGCEVHFLPAISGG